MTKKKFLVCGKEGFQNVLVDNVFNNADPQQDGR